MSFGYFQGRRSGKTTLHKLLQATVKESLALAKNQQLPQHSTQSEAEHTARLEVSIKPECKLWLDELADELKQTRDVITKYNQSRGADGLLAALQAEAASDAPESDDDLLELGQWVFEGQDDKWIGAAVDEDGQGWLFTSNNFVSGRRPKLFNDGIKAVCLDELEHQWVVESGVTVKYIGSGFNTENWDKSFIVRESTDSQLLDLGQWVFEGQDDKWIGAAVDKDGKGFLFSCNSNLIERGASCWTPPEVYEILPLPGLFNAIDWDKSFIDRDLPDLDQSVFDGQDEQWVGAAVDKDGNGYLFGCDSLNVELRPSVWQPSFGVDYKVKLLHGKFNAMDVDKSVIYRQPLNDVDFEDALTGEKETIESEFVCTIEHNLFEFFGINIDENPTPELSYSDLQRIFVQNLTTVLIQRMHSLDRFSGEDKVIKFGSLLPWDILYVPTSDPAKKFAVATHPVSHSWFVGLDVLPRTIYESEIEEFRKWAEAYYHYV